MSEQNGSKVNRLLRELGDADLASARWLRAQGYSSSLLARYVRSAGWSRLRAGSTRIPGPAFAGLALCNRCNIAKV